ncbi:MAG: aryl-sulfate sulfotransferase, partial [Bryobacteraceae bacterium]
FVLVAPTASTESHLLRNDGTVAHTWPGTNRAGLAVKLLQDGTILRSGVISSSIFRNGAGAGGHVEKRSWNGDLLWSYFIPDEKFLQHHDVEGLPNGNILILAWRFHTAEEAISAGRRAGTFPEQGIWSDSILEVKPTGPDSGEIVWQWHAWDHLVQDADSTKANYGVVEGNYKRIDLNFTSNMANPSTNPDWLHLNNVRYNEKLDQIMVSSRPWSEVWIIDHSTTPEEAASSKGGRQGHGGDLLYRWGNPRSYRRGGAAEQTLINPHDAHWIADGLIGAGRMLVFNNGTGRGYASADEVVLPVDAKGGYPLDPSGRFGPAAPIWTFGETAPPPFTSPTGSSAQRLPNGNTLICVSNANRIVEVTPEKEIVWDVNLGAGSAGGYTFRATRLFPESAELHTTALAAPAPEIRHAASLRPSSGAAGGLILASGTGFPMSPAEATIVDASGASFKLQAANASAGSLTIQIPAAATPGPARLKIPAANGTTQSRDFRINASEPGLFAINGDGEGPGAISALIDGQQPMLAYTFDNSSNRYVAAEIPLKGDVYLSVFGTGLGTARMPLAVVIGGTPIPVTAVAQSAQFPGVDQINVGPVPRALAGKRNLPVVLSAGEAVSNAVVVSFQ